jgi:hypothetical protein
MHYLHLDDVTHQCYLDDTQCYLDDVTHQGRPVSGPNHALCHTDDATHQCRPVSGPNHALCHTDDVTHQCRPVSGPIARTGSGRLYQIKGRQWVRSVVVPSNPRVMNSGDVFVYDTDGKGIYIWSGSNTTRNKRAKGAHKP